MAGAYLGDTDPRTPLASPLFADDLSGLPPVCIEVGAHEVLLDDAIGLADRLRSAGGQSRARPSGLNCSMSSRPFRLR